MRRSVETLDDLFRRGLIAPSEDFNVVRQPDGRMQVKLRKSLAAGAAAPSCACTPADLPSICEVIGDFTSTIDVNAASLDVASCFDVTYSGSNDAGVLAFIDFHTDRNPTGWALGFDDGHTTPSLFKVAGSGTNPDCDIESPVGVYEGDGYTATVGAII